MCEKVARDDLKSGMQNDLGLLFTQHLREHHNIDAGKKDEQGKQYTSDFIRAHLKGEHTLIPLGIFSPDLSALETLVKYLRENEQFTNSAVARMLARTPASVWITYRNACRKHPEKLQPAMSRTAIPTSEIAGSGLSVLESIAHYLLQQGMTYAEIGRALGRDERTIWTVCSRARKKLGMMKKSGVKKTLGGEAS